MSQKTEPTDNTGGKQQHLIPTALLVQLCLIALVALTLMIVLERVVMAGARMRTELQIDSPLVYPWITVGNTTLTAALRGFEGRIPGILSVKIYLLAGMLIVFVMCPTFFLFGWRRRRLARMSGSFAPIRSLRDVSSIGYAFSGVVVFFVVVTIGPLTAIQMTQSASRCESDAARLLRYETTTELNFILDNILQYRLLPKEVGGGNGSYIGYVIPENLARTDKAEYTATVKADKVIVKAESANCATNTITATLDAHGSARPMDFEGNWGYG
ncbi:MAG: hypothetical protein NTZ35_09115 [Ignavibacteriales bacterium]|nr:hypothetical protein [Ignavibacteriales bacterium]